MNNLKSLNVKRKIIIILSLLWIVLSFVTTIYIIVEDGSTDTLENFLTFLISFLIFTAPVSMYWAAFWIWGEAMERFINNLLTNSLRKLTSLSKNIIPIIKKNLYTAALLLLIIVVALISRAFVKGVFKSFDCSIKSCVSTPPSKKPTPQTSQKTFG